MCADGGSLATLSTDYGVGCNSYGAAWSLKDNAGDWHVYFSGNTGGYRLYEPQLTSVVLSAEQKGSVNLIQMGVSTQEVAPIPGMSIDDNDGSLRIHTGSLRFDSHLNQVCIVVTCQ